MPDRTSTPAAQPETVALFVSDLHLHPGLPLTLQAFLDFLGTHARKSPRLYLLGDVFEYWAGDDDLEDALHQRITHEIRQTAASGTAVYWIAGNRDFLVGQAFADAAGMSLLPDPHVELIAGQRIVLTHGDAQCTDDRAYMAFRASVRQPEWQAQFLAQPLAQRKAMIEGLRQESRAAQREKSYEIMDVNPDAVASLFRSTDAARMIHGHTHRPADHRHEIDGRRCSRHVLPDWDCDARPPRGGWLSMDAGGAIRRYDWNGTLLSIAN